MKNVTQDLVITGDRKLSMNQLFATSTEYALHIALSRAVPGQLVMVIIQYTLYGRKCDESSCHRETRTLRPLPSILSYFCPAHRQSIAYEEGSKEGRGKVLLSSKKLAALKGR